MKNGITIFVPALNEEKALQKTIKNVIQAASHAGSTSFEIIIVNDGSTDNTRTVIRKIEMNYPFVHSIHHSRNLGWGIGFKEALAIAKYPKITLFPGDGFISTQTLSKMIRYAYRAEVVCVYLLNKQHRPFLRKLLSSLFTFIYKVTFGLPIQYVNATPVYPVEVVKKMNLRCQRYSFPSEVTVRLLRKGSSFVEIGGYMNPNVNKSSALQLKNLLEAALNYFWLIMDIYFLNQGEYNFKPARIQDDSG